LLCWSYLLSTLDLGLVFSKKATASLEPYIYFPLPETCETHNGPSLTTFCDANRGPHDDLHSSFMNSHPVSIYESKSICCYLFFYGSCPILWKTYKEACISHSSCKYEIKATDECVKKCLGFLLLTICLYLGSTGPTLIYNNNRGAVDWSHSFSTKGMHYLNIWEHAVRESQNL